MKVIEGTFLSKQQVHYKSKQRSKSMEEWTKSWQFEQKKVDLNDLNKINTFEQNKSQQFGWENFDIIQQLNIKQQEKITNKQGKNKAKLLQVIFFKALD